LLAIANNPPNVMKLTTVIRPVRLLLLCLTVVMGVGCETFRWHEYACQDLVQRNQERHENNGFMFKPGTIFYSQ
jgi:hypothetical protein